MSMTCVLRVPVEHAQYWPGTPQQVAHQIRAVLGEDPKMQFSTWHGYVEFWVSENNAVLAKAARDDACLTVTIARDRQKYRYVLLPLDSVVPQYFKNPKPDARVLLL